MFLDVRLAARDARRVRPQHLRRARAAGRRIPPQITRQNGLLYTYTSEPERWAADLLQHHPAGTADHQNVVAEWRVPNPATRRRWSIRPAGASSCG